MKYSESSDYMDYVRSKATGDIAAAKASLAACLRQPALRTEPDQYADLLQRMGELCFLEGNREEAVSHYAESERANPKSLLVKYYRAEFLGKRIGDKRAAIEICDLIISIAHDEPFAETEDDFSSDAYVEKAQQLKTLLTQGDA